MKALLASKKDGFACRPCGIVARSLKSTHIENKLFRLRNRFVNFSFGLDFFSVRISCGRKNGWKTCVEEIEKDKRKTKCGHIECKNVRKNWFSISFKLHSKPVHSQIGKLREYQRNQQCVRIEKKSLNLRFACKKIDRGCDIKIWLLSSIFFFHIC